MNICKGTEYTSQSKRRSLIKNVFLLITSSLLFSYFGTIVTNSRVISEVFFFFFYCCVYLLVFIESCCKSLILAVHILKFWRICKQWMYWSCLICKSHLLHLGPQESQIWHNLCFRKISVTLHYIYFWVMWTYIVSYNWTFCNQFLLILRGSTISVFKLLPLIISLWYMIDSCKH